MSITIIGLGPGDPRHLTREAWEILAAAGEVYLRTTRHPTLEQPGAPAPAAIHSFDRIYETAESFEEMYSPSAASIGRTRTASTDWMMFGFYIRNNIGVAFQSFAGGLFAGIGTLFFLAYNGAFSGALAGYLTERGLSHTFYAFVATHSAFELTAVALSGAAGLRIGRAVTAPGRLSRLQALVQAARDSAVLLYGVTGMLCVAAAIEAFWSSAVWIPPAVKYSVAGICWTTVFAYFALQGRRAS